MNRLFHLLLITVAFSRAYPQNISAEQYIAKYKKIAIEEMREYNIPASIILAQAMHESGNGNSKLARKANNHFGIKCQDNWKGDTFFQDDDKEDECFRKYGDAEESFRDHSKFIRERTRYSFLFDFKADDYISWAKGLKTAGYATNPKYPELLINIIERYRLNELDSDVNKAAEKRSIAENLKKDKNNKKHASYAESREIIMKNRIKAVIARKGDNYEILAKELEMFRWQILKYNDMQKNDSIQEGDIIYLQPKKARGNADYHIFAKGETVREVSQLYGIKLKSLLRKNNLTPGKMPEEGQKLYLRKKVR